MRKTYSLLVGMFGMLCMIGFANPSNAQNERDTVTHFDINGQFNHFLFQSSTPQSCNYGYVFGHSCYEYKGFAEKYTFSDSVMIEGMFAYVVHSLNEDSVVSTDSAHFKVYSDSTNYPDSVLGAKKISYQDLKVNAPSGISDRRYDNFTYADLTSDSIIIKGSVFASFELPEYRNNFNASNSHLDTLGLRTSTDQNVNVVNRVQARGGSWFLTPDQLSEVDNGVYYYLAPVVKPVEQDQPPTGKEPFAKIGALGLINSYPTAVKNDLNLEFSLDQPAQVNITVYSTSGKQVHQEDFSKLNNGNHEVQLNLSDLSAGSYIYVIKSNKGMLSGKFMKE